MRLHRLEIQAFGPFRDRQVVDFDNLSAAGLFLLHGSTGAGKSSVLDAVCFALFGRVPGPRATVTGLRSHYAEAAEMPEVELEFSVGPRRLLVRRSPSWERPKKRGSGTTTTQARVIVQEWQDQGWQPRTTRLDEAGHLLQDVLGMGPEEFTKLVLLPQGEFAAFLRADAETRRTLLEKIFATDRYTAVQDWIRDHRATARARLDSVDRRTATLLAQAEQAATVALRSLPASTTLQAPAESSDSGDADALRRVDDLVTTLGPLREQAVNDHLEAAAEAEKFEVRLAQAQAMTQLATQFSTLIERQQTVEARAGEIELVRARLDAARRAAPMSALLGALSQARSGTLAARVRLEPLAAQLISAPEGRATDLESTDLEATDLATHWAGERDRITTELDSLAAAVPVLAERDRIAADLDQVEQTVDRGRVDLERANSALAEALTATDQADTDCAAARLVAATVDADQMALDQARVRETAVHERDRLQAQLTELDSGLVRARQEALTAREHYLDVRERRLDGLAAELAATLDEGQPCRVCGATEHPAPAAPAPDAVSPQDETAARAAADQATDEVSQLVARRAATEAALQAQAEAAGGLDAATAAAQSRQAAHQLAVSRSAAAQVISLQELAEQRRRDAGQARARLDQANAHTQTAEQQRAVLRAQAAAVASRLAERLGARRGEGSDEVLDDAAAVDAALGHARRRRELVEAALTAHAQLRDAAHHLSTVEDAARLAAAQGGFSGLDEAVAAVLDDGAMAVLERAVIEHTVEAESVDEQLTDERFTVLHDGDAAVLDGEAMRQLSLGGEHVTLREQEALRRAALCESALAEVEQLRDQLVRHLESSAPLTEEFAALDDLTRCLDGTGGDNTLRMSLSAYVLAARLEQVASAATVRLAQMSGGRYALVHTDAAGRGRGRAGLTLEVMDAWTGVRRATSTLSGGEAFYTSLALALGLADVVSAEAGGVHLDTLFIDEGFGSLDEDTLDEVMDTLDDLRSGGRAVGIVSHLAELRQRIGVRLEVDKSERGSTLTLAG